jgi:hypothetical protein
MLSATGMSRTMPSALRSSGTSATPARIAASGSPRRSGLPSTFTLPEATGSAPAMARTSSVRPAPTIPAMPRISPALTANETSRNAPAADVKPETRSTSPAPAVPVSGNSHHGWLAVDHRHDRAPHARRHVLEPCLVDVVSAGGPFRGRCRVCCQR